MITQQFKQNLTALRLSGLLNSLELRIQEAQSSQLSHLQFLELLIQDEQDLRDQRRLKRLEKRARFAEPKSLEDFDFTFNTSVKKSLIYELATGKYITKAEDVLFVGPPGTGKSHLSQALGYQAIRQGYVVMYRSIFDLVVELISITESKEREKNLRKYLACDLLIIDDMGIKQLPNKTGETLFEIVLRRHKKKSTMMTSNRPIDEWGKLIGDAPATSAILDRFLSHSHLMNITGKSYRMKNRSCENQIDK